MTEGLSLKALVEMLVRVPKDIQLTEEKLLETFTTQRPKIKKGIVLHFEQH